MGSWSRLPCAHHLGRGGGFCPVALTAVVGFCLLPCPLPLTLVSRAQDFRGPRAVVLQAKPALGRASAPAVWSATRARGTHASFPLHGVECLRHSWPAHCLLLAKESSTQWKLSKETIPKWRVLYVHVCIMYIRACL